ncbi:hypothetical protein MOQ72_26730 [Saccharopolyspora sp. K220]|uniref:hypothetical protein n=1 Tax=Saccharopolyspora soli TaxID=2926618 RepID=UPI001F59402C|nr:hypothetical protein [Saccharopolyspora soli]MCI2421045.1 hypothetical protein [Saccharopolyspora soli]
MALSDRILRGVACGEISLAFLRWSSPQARAGSQLRTAVGLIGIDEVTEVDPGQITDADARRAGFSSAAGLRSSLDKHGPGSVYRLALRYEGLAPASPQEPVVLGGRERAAIDRRLAQLDVSAPRGPWTRQVLEVLARRPGVRVAELAAEQGRPVSRWKSDVWRLRELGLVEPLAAGFRLSSRGVSYLDGPG